MAYGIVLNLIKSDDIRISVSFNFYKKDLMFKYQVIKNAVSFELANFIFNYFLLKRDAVDFMYKTISYMIMACLALGQINRFLIHIPLLDMVMETLLMKVLPRMQKETGLQLIPTYSYARLYKNGDI